MRRHTAAKTVALVCLCCGAVLIPSGLEGQALREAHAAALTHAQGEIRAAGVGETRLQAGVSFWRVLCATGGGR